MDAQATIDIIANRFMEERASRRLVAREAVVEAIVTGQGVEEARATLAAIDALPAEFDRKEDRAALLGKWPKTFDPLPLYVTDPVAAKAEEDAYLAENGLERTGDLVVDGATMADGEEEAEKQAAALNALDPKTEESIIAKRASRKALDDAAVEAFRAKTAEKETEEARLERRLGFSIANIRKLLGLG